VLKHQGKSKVMSEIETTNEINEIKIPQSSIEQEIRTSFLDYTMFVNVDQGISDVNDGG
jgi:DNA gyrase/topoisomerase IV subunit A